MHSPVTKHIISVMIFILLSAAVIMYFTRFVEIKIIANKFLPKVEDTLTLSEDTSETENDVSDESEAINEPDVVEDFILDESKDFGSAYVEKIIFLGDKNTYAMGRYTYTGIPDPMRQVWSVENNVSPSKITGVNNFIYPASLEATNYLTAIKDRAPAFLILSFGSFSENEILTRDRMITSLGDFIINAKQVSPNTQIMIQSIFPVGENCSVLTNEEVRERNEWLKELCKIYRVFYIDSWSVLVDEAGMLNPMYASDDGYLLNESGYKTVVDYIKNHVHPVYANANEY